MSPSPCGATLRAATGNELARARTLDGEGAPLLAAVTRAGQLYTCSRPAGHAGDHEERMGGGFAVTWSDAAEVEPPPARRLTRKEHDALLRGSIR